MVCALTASLRDQRLDDQYHPDVCQNISQIRPKDMRSAPRPLLLGKGCCGNQAGGQEGSPGASGRQGTGCQMISGDLSFVILRDNGLSTYRICAKKGEPPKRGGSSSDFFVKQGERIFVVEIMGDEEVSEPFAENVKKHEYASEHFRRLNERLQEEGAAARYQFNMLTPRDFNKFFQKLREGDLVGFRSELDVAVAKAGNGKG